MLALKKAIPQGTRVLAQIQMIRLMLDLQCLLRLPLQSSHAATRFGRVMLLYFAFLLKASES